MRAVPHKLYLWTPTLVAQTLYKLCPSLPVQYSVKCVPSAQHDRSRISKVCQVSHVSHCLNNYAIMVTVILTVSKKVCRLLRQWWQFIKTQVTGQTSYLTLHHMRIYNKADNSFFLTVQHFHCRQLNRLHYVNQYHTKSRRPGKVSALIMNREKGSKIFTTILQEAMGFTKTLIINKPLKLNNIRWI